MQSHLFFLVGFMASGKTTFGKKVAARLAANFWDLDNYIEETQQQSIAAIFAAQGEDAFRAIEHNALVQFIEEKKAQTGVHIVACGGGTPCFFNNMELLKQAGKVIYLQQDFAILLGRLRTLQSSRPMLANLSSEELGEFISQLVAAREPYYTQAHCIVHLPNVQRMQAAITEYLSLNYT